MWSSGLWPLEWERRLPADWEWNRFSPHSPLFISQITALWIWAVNFPSCVLLQKLKVSTRFISCLNSDLFKHSCLVCSFCGSLKFYKLFQQKQTCWRFIQSFTAAGRSFKTTVLSLRKNSVSASTGGRNYYLA